MANWCYNVICLSGKYKNFAKQLKKHDYKIQGFEIVRPGENTRCIFELDEQGEDTFSFTSKWIPPIEELVERAKKGGFSFQLDFEELGCGIYGRAYYKDGVLDEYYLDDSIFRRTDWDDDVFRVDGEEVESESEFLEEELEKLVKLKRGG